MSGPGVDVRSLILSISLVSECILVFLSFSLASRVHMIDFPLSQGTMWSQWELRHLAGSPGGGVGVFRFCHTLISVKTV